MSEPGSQVEDVRIKQNKGVYLTWQAIATIIMVVFAAGGIWSVVKETIEDLKVIKRRVDTKSDRLEDEIEEKAKESSVKFDEMLVIMTQANDKLIEISKKQASQEGYHDGWTEGRKDLMETVKFTHYSERGIK